jgi:hypothetical protein
MNTYVNINTMPLLPLLLPSLSPQAFADAIEGPYLEAAFVDSERCLSEVRKQLKTALRNGFVLKD